MRRPGILLGLPVVLLAALAATAGPAAATTPDGNGGGHHVKRQRPWQADGLYLVEHGFRVRVDPSRDAPATGTTIAAGTWLHIDCQSPATSSAGTETWDRVAGGFVPDALMKTYQVGPLAGAPACAFPHPNRVYHEQAWTKASRYKAQVTQVTQKKPNLLHGTGHLVHAGDFILIRCQTTGASVKGSRLWDLTASGGYYPDADVKTYYDGPIPGAPACGTHPHVPPKPVYMALGDSYSSGLGASLSEASGGLTDDGHPYYEPNPFGRTGKDCDRSPDAYSRYLAGRTRVAMRSDPATTFLACQGDTTSDVLRYQVPHVPRSTALVTLTAMGNDMGFSSVIETCAELGDCPKKVAAEFGAHYQILATRIHGLDRVLAAIHRRAPRALVLVGGYPKLFAPPHEALDKCGHLTTSEQKLLDKAGGRLDAAIAASARRHPGARYVGVAKAFAGHGPCQSEDPAMWINPIKLKGSFPHYSAEPFSMHPNHFGHITYAEAFAEAAPSVFR